MKVYIAKKAPIDRRTNPLSTQKFGNTVTIKYVGNNEPVDYDNIARPSAYIKALNNDPKIEWVSVHAI